MYQESFPLNKIFISFPYHKTDSSSNKQFVSLTLFLLYMPQNISMF